MNRVAPGNSSLLFLRLNLRLLKQNFDELIDVERGERLQVGDVELVADEEVGEAGQAVGGVKRVEKGGERGDGRLR